MHSIGDTSTDPRALRWNGPRDSGGEPTSLGRRERGLETSMSRESSASVVTHERPGSRENEVGKLRNPTGRIPRHSGEDRENRNEVGRGGAVSTGFRFYVLIGVTTVGERETLGFVVFRRVPNHVTTIDVCLDAHDDQLRPLVWTASAASMRERQRRTQSVTKSGTRRRRQFARRN